MLRMVSAVIVAAGKGVRMGPGTDKLWLEVAGRPIISHTWKRVDQGASVREGIVVGRDGMQAEFEKLAASNNLSKPWRLVIGGKERQDSVWNGLQAVATGTEIVAIQDAARPCTTVEVFEASIAAARESGAAVAAQRVTDTVKESADGSTIARHLDRSRLWAVQTPQTFRLGVIRRALSEVRNKGLLITDDTAACELIGQPVRLVESTAPNPKATAPSDLPYLELLLGSAAG